MDQVFKALSDPGRRKLLDRLFTSSGLTLTEMCADMDMSRQAVTQHLAVLEDANLVSTRWRGREKLHFLNPVPIHEIYDRWVKKFERRSLKALDRLKKTLEGERHD
jgi:DNA-binding transcriptional ArsR family regulator